MTQLIKPNDLVYIPHFSTCILTAVEYNSHGRLCIDFEEEEYSFMSDGKLQYNDVAPLVYLATPENKAKLEEFYGITLQDIPVDEELEKFSRAVQELSNYYASLCISDGNYKVTDKIEELKSIKGNLIQMFKERGTK